MGNAQSGSTTSPTKATPPPSTHTPARPQHTPNGSSHQNSMLNGSAAPPAHKLPGLERRIKTKSLDLPDLASLGLAITTLPNPYAYRAQGSARLNGSHSQRPQPKTATASIPIPNTNGAEYRQRPRPKNYDSNSQLFSERSDDGEHSTHIPLLYHKEAGPSQTNPVFEDGEQQEHLLRPNGYGDVNGVHQSTVSTAAKGKGKAKQDSDTLQSNSVILRLQAPPPSPTPSHHSQTPYVNGHGQHVNGGRHTNHNYTPPEEPSSYEDEKPIIVKSSHSTVLKLPKRSQEGLEPVMATIRWTGGGDTVYLARAGDEEWRGRKLLTREPSSLTHSIVIPLLPGTHHLRFLVDDQWRVADDLPAAVDDQGSLANYISVGLDHPSNIIIGGDVDGGSTPPGVDGDGVSSGRNSHEQASIETTSSVAGSDSGSGGKKTEITSSSGSGLADANLHSAEGRTTSNGQRAGHARGMSIPLPPPLAPGHVSTAPPTGTGCHRARRPPLPAGMSFWSYSSASDGGTSDTDKEHSESDTVPNLLRMTNLDGTTVGGKARHERNGSLKKKTTTKRKSKSRFGDRWTDEIPPELLEAAKEEEDYLTRLEQEAQAPSQPPPQPARGRASRPASRGGSQQQATFVVTGFNPPPQIPNPPLLPRQLEKLILNQRAPQQIVVSSAGTVVGAYGGTPGSHTHHRKESRKERDGRKNSRRERKDRSHSNNPSIAGPHIFDRPPIPSLALPPILVVDRPATPNMDSSVPPSALEESDTDRTERLAVVGAVPENVPLPASGQVSPYLEPADQPGSSLTPSSSFGLPPNISLPSSSYTSAVGTSVPPTPAPPSAQPIPIDDTVVADDSSVLPVPSHVVLQHLSTSAIKNGVLAVGGTTRYHGKYLTSVYYKPASGT